MATPTSIHWIYRIIPPDRSQVRWYSWLFWSLLGNDEDGAMGERSAVPGYGKEAPQSLWQFLRWLSRNPAHNFCFHDINWPGGPVFKWGKRPGWNGYIGWRPTADGNGVFGVAFRHEEN